MAHKFILPLDEIPELDSTTYKAGRNYPRSFKDRGIIFDRCTAHSRNALPNAFLPDGTPVCGTKIAKTNKRCMHPPAPGARRCSYHDRGAHLRKSSKSRKENEPHGVFSEVLRGSALTLYLRELANPTRMDELLAYCLAKFYQATGELERRQTENIAKEKDGEEPLPTASIEKAWNTWFSRVERLMKFKSGETLNINQKTPYEEIERLIGPLFRSKAVAGGLVKATEKASIDVGIIGPVAEA